MTVFTRILMIYLQTRLTRTGIFLSKPKLLSLISLAGIPRSTSR